MLISATILAASDAVSSAIPGANELGGIVGLLNYGVLGILTVGFIKGWVVSPRERDRLLKELDQSQADVKAKEAEVARLNVVIQENLQAMTATMDKQIDLARAAAREGSTRRGNA